MDATLALRVQRVLGGLPVELRHVLQAEYTDGGRRAGSVKCALGVTWREWRDARERALAVFAAQWQDARRA
jgi:hypothetical protein